MVPDALARARRRAAAAGAEARFVEGDVTDLGEFGVDGGFILILDFGCLHTLPADQRQAYVRSVSAAAGPGATLLRVWLRAASAPCADAGWSDRRRSPAALRRREAGRH